MRNDNIKKSDIFWNTIGTVTYSSVSMLLSIIIINIAGKIDGGIFSFGFSTLAHIVFIISYFGMRPLHIIDINYRYSAKQYIHFGIISTFIAIMIGMSYVSFLYYNGTYSLNKFLIMALLVIHGGIDGFADYFECEFQRENKLSITGQNLFFRIVFFTSSLIVSIYITKKFVLSLIIAIIFELISFYYLNIKRGVRLFKTANTTTLDCKNLFFETLPLFLIVFFDMFLFSQSKIAIDLYLNDNYSGFFNLIFLPTNCIYLTMSLVIKPLLTPLATAYCNDKKAYVKMLILIFVFSIFLSVAFLVGTYFIGDIYINILDYITGNIYAEYLIVAKKILLVAIGGGCFYTILTPLYYSMIIEREQKVLAFVYLLNCIFSIFVSRIFVLNLGITGASYAFLINMFLLVFSLFIVKVILYGIFRKKL